MAGEAPALRFICRLLGAHIRNRARARLYLVDYDHEHEQEIKWPRDNAEPVPFA